MRTAKKAGSRLVLCGGSARRPAAGTRASGVARRRPEEPRHLPSPTAVAAEALRSGIVPLAVPRGTDNDTLPRAAERIRAGDPDDEALRNEYVGEEVPGGSTPTPDQGNVDDIGRAYGLQDEDNGELHTGAEVMARRDRRRRGFLGKG